MASRDSVEHHKKQVAKNLAAVDEAMALMETHCQSGMYLYSIHKDEEKGRKELERGILKTKAKLMTAKFQLKQSTDFLFGKISKQENEVIVLKESAGTSLRKLSSLMCSGIFDEFTDQESTASTTSSTKQTESPSARENSCTTSTSVLNSTDGYCDEDNSQSLFTPSPAKKSKEWEYIYTDLEHGPS